MTFVRNHAKAIIATDFFIVVTATFRLVYVLVIMEVGTQRILHMNVTQHPTAEWTLQQFRECVTGIEGDLRAGIAVLAGFDHLFGAPDYLHIDRHQ